MARSTHDTYTAHDRAERRARRRPRPVTRRQNTRSAVVLAAILEG